MKKNKSKYKYQNQSSKGDGESVQISNSGPLKTFLPPGIRLGESPPFYNMDDYTFQDMCRDLFDAEQDISTCDVYGTRGQSQNGIDLLAYRKNGDGIEVGQCKCYKDFPPAEIRKASDEFFKYWDGRWSKKEVKRFILFVACDLCKKQRQDEINRQWKRFKDFGINYEAWSAAKIRRKLQPYPSIVATYFSNSDYWIKIICSSISPLAIPTEIQEPQISIVSEALVTHQITQYATQIKQLSTGVSGEVEGHLQLMREAWREGKEEEPIKWLKKMRTNNVLWQSLSPDIKANLLCFEASLELDLTGDLNQSRKLVDEAHSLAPSDNNARLLAYINYLKDGPESAIKLLLTQKDIDSINLRALLYLEIGNIDECRKDLSLKDTGLEPNAETFRIRSLFYLVTKNLNQARLEIQKAKELKPRWENIHYTAAIIDYFSALSPVILASRLLPWPEPVDWILVKRNDESLKHLRKASNTFKELTKRAIKKTKVRKRLEAWRLACLANDPEKQEEAIEYCQGILRSDPTHYQAIMWAIARNFTIDLEPGIKALETITAHESVNIPHIHALIICYLSSRNAKKAIKLLKRTKAIFQKHRMDILWVLCYSQSLIVDGDCKGALKVISTSGAEEELSHIKTMALRALAKSTNDWQKVIQHLENSYKKTKDPNFLFECCELMAQQNQWTYVADQATRLVEALGTSEALRLAAIALFNVQRYDFCLSLLDGHLEFFSQKKLPLELRRMRSLCHKELGNLPKAIIEAEELVRDDPSTEHLLTLIHIYIAKGDFRGVAIAARQVSDRPDLPAEQLLQIIEFIKGEDQQLSISLWRQALGYGVPDEAVGKALFIGFALGLDNELGPLQSRMTKLGRKGQGGIQKATIEDLIAFVEQLRNQREKLNEFYLSGTLPIHLISEQLNCPLSDFYYWFLKINESSPTPTRQFALLARHGGHELVKGFPSDAPQWRIHLDLTAILLAAYLEILTEVEKTFKPLHIPADLTLALFQMCNRLSHTQPSQLQSYQQITDLVKQKCLEVVDCNLPPGYENNELIEELGENWISLYEHTRTSNGYLVDFLPLQKLDRKGPPSSLPKDANHHLVSCSALLEPLREQGPLSEDEYKKAITALGYEKPYTIIKKEIKMGAPLFCHANIPEVLAGANLLHIICKYFQVRIEKAEFDRVCNELQVHERRCAEQRWLGDLIDRISKGIDNGTYKLIVVPAVEGEKDGGATPMGLNERCLISLLRFKSQEGDVIWADDRFLNSYFYCGSIPIIGINEVLKALVIAKALSKGKYYHLLYRLRAANMRFIPVQKDEIIYHLRQAKVENGIVIETQELSVLRRYIAACLLQGEMLQRPPVPDRAPNKNGEIAFLMGLSHAIIDAVIEVWKTEEEVVDNRRARAEWLMTNLFLEHLGLFNLTSLSRPPQDEQYLVAISFAGLISQAIIFIPKPDGIGTSLRKEFFDWLFYRFLQKRCDVDPNLLVPIADIMKKTLAPGQKEVMGEKLLRQELRVLQLFYEDLPKPIKDELTSDTEFMASIGIKVQNIATVDDLNFNQQDFYRAASEAINGREAKIVPIELDTEVTFKPSQDVQGRRIFYFNHPVTGKKRLVIDDGLELLLESPGQREAALRKNRHWFDCSDKILNEVIAEIASTEDFQQRLNKAEPWRCSSATVYYATLHQKIKNNKATVNDLLPPSAAGLLRHFRFNNNMMAGSAFQKAFNDAAQALIREEGLPAAIYRLAGFPISLPPALIKGITGLPTEEKHSLIKSLISMAGSPLSIFHFVNILLHIDDSDSKIAAYRRLARRIILKIISAEKTTSFDAFFSILNWVSVEIGYWPEAREWSSHIRLAMVWAHTHQLFTSAVAAGAPIEWLRDKFTQQDRRIPIETFDRNLDYWNDIVHPRQISREMFLLSGLSYCLGKDATSLVNKELGKKFTKLIFPEDDEGKMLPILPLLRDPTQAQNSLGSFLGDDRGAKLAPLIGNGDAKNFSRQTLQAFVEEAISKLVKGEDKFLFWARIHTILWNLPPYKKLIKRFKTIIKQTDFEGLFEKDIGNGIFVLQTASIQMINLGDEDLRFYMKNQLVKIAKFLTKKEKPMGSHNSPHKESFSDSEKFYRFLIDTALSISIAAQPRQNVISEFVDLLTHLVETWHTMIPYLRPIVQRLCEELPISQAKQFWPLLIKLRAE